MARGRPLRRVGGDPAYPLSPDSWPGSIPAVRQLLDEGLELDGLTMLVGENGSGKSTLVEGLAMAFGMSAEGGSTGARHATRSSESVLHRHLTLTREPGGPRWGFFLRAETMHSFYTYLEDNPNPYRAPDTAFHELSHGESFLELIAARFDDPGLYVLDEPEAALSFSGALALVGVLQDIAGSYHAQAVVATHSPIVAATPGAVLYEAGPWGLRRSSWEELSLVQHWKSFLDAPERYFRHLR